MQSTMSDLFQLREKLVRDHFEDEVKQDFESVLSTFPHPRYEIIPTGQIYDGSDEVNAYYRATREAFPDQRHEMIQLRHSDDAVIVEFYLLGTHAGRFQGLAPSGATFRVRMTAYFIFEGETLVCERIYFDTMSMIKQLIGDFKFWKPSSWLRLIRVLRLSKAMQANRKGGNK